MSTQLCKVCEKAKTRSMPPVCSVCSRTVRGKEIKKNYENTRDLYMVPQDVKTRENSECADGEVSIPESSDTPKSLKSESNYEYDDLEDNDVSESSSDRWRQAMVTINLPSVYHEDPTPFLPGREEIARIIEVLREACGKNWANYCIACVEDTKKMHKHLHIYWKVNPCRNFAKIKRTIQLEYSKMWPETCSRIPLEDRRDLTEKFYKKLDVPFMVKCAKEVEQSIAYIFKVGPNDISSLSVESLLQKHPDVYYYSDRLLEDPSDIGKAFDLSKIVDMIKLASPTMKYYKLLEYSEGTKSKNKTLPVVGNNFTRRILNDLIESCIYIDGTLSKYSELKCVYLFKKKLPRPDVQTMSFANLIRSDRLSNINLWSRYLDRRMTWPEFWNFMTVKYQGELTDSNLAKTWREFETQLREGIFTSLMVYRSTNFAEWSNGIFDFGTGIFYLREITADEDVMANDIDRWYYGAYDNYIDSTTGERISKSEIFDFKGNIFPGINYSEPFPGEDYLHTGGLKYFEFMQAAKVPIQSWCSSVKELLKVPETDKTKSSIYLSGPTNCGKSTLAAPVLTYLRDSGRGKTLSQAKANFMFQGCEKVPKGTILSNEEWVQKDLSKNSLCTLKCILDGSETQINRVGAPAITVNLRLNAIFCTNDSVKLEDAQLESFYERFNVIQMGKNTNKRFMMHNYPKQEISRYLKDNSHRILAGICRKGSEQIIEEIADYCRVEIEYMDEEDDYVPSVESWQYEKPQHVQYDPLMLYIPQKKKNDEPIIVEGEDGVPYIFNSETFEFVVA